MHLNTSKELIRDVARWQPSFLKRTLALSEKPYRAFVRNNLCYPDYNSMLKSEWTFRLVFFFTSYSDTK